MSVSLFKIPSVVVGLTIVAMGTSAPEAAISISAALKGSTGIAIGNVIGSNIMNILLILGITSCIVPLAVAKSTVKYEIPFTIFITAVLVVYGAIFGEMDLIGGCILWILFIGFFIYLIRMSKNSETPETEEEEKHSLIMLIIFILGGLVAIVYGSNFTVDSATAIAKVFGVSDRIIGLTIVAFGTSLPELVTSVVAARKNEVDMAVGNAVGSNIFNILMVLGIASAINPVSLIRENVIDIIILVVFSVVVWIFAATKKKISRKEGIAMVAMYLVYAVYIILR